MANRGKPVQVLIVGGGFGGRYAAMRLAYGLPPGSRIILVDQHDYMLYTPMLTEAAGRSVSLKHIQAPNRELSRRIHFIQGIVRSANLREKTVELTSGTTLYGDHVLFALGSTTNYRGVEGAQEYSLTMKTVDDARRVRTMAQRRVEQAAFEEDAEKRSLLLSFVVAGGGYTGVETIAALNDLVRDTARQHGVALSELSVTLVEPTQRLMAEMPGSLGAYGKEVLQADGIQVHIGDRVQRVEPGQITLTSGKRIPAGMVIWDAGIRPNPLVDAFDCPKGKKGGIATDSALRVVERSGVWAIGDCTEIPKPDHSGHFFEPTAQNATRQGTHVAKNILATVYGRPVRPFRYKQIGELAVISRYRGVANVFGVQVRGFTAWLMWRAIYLVKMPSMRQRLGILADWIRLLIGRSHVPLTWRLQPVLNAAQQQT